MLELPHPIAELTYIPPEQIPATPGERRSIYDVYCVDSAGNRFIVEMQRELQVNIKERALYYAAQAIVYQAQRGQDWDYSVLPVYCIVVLDFDLGIKNELGV